MPWKGPDEDNRWPTLGYDVGEWIEAHLVVPDGYRKGEPYKLTDEMWRFLLRFYRLLPDAEPWPAAESYACYGGQLRRSQKWGKDPFGAAIIWAEAEGPTRFDGWDSRGEPVGKPYPTPLIVCVGTSEEQTDNTWRPLLAMARNGPMANLPGLDLGETRIVLPGGGKIEPVTASARARLGAPMTMATLTETHLFTLQGGFRKLAGAVKRNIAGMDGRWLELTNAWDPTEGSEAQVTAESGDERVYVDTIEPRRVEDLETDEELLYRELLRQYGDSARERGGWVNIKGRIIHEVRSKRHLEADRRRFFLNEIVVGQSAFVAPERWDFLARPGEPLEQGEPIALGFDGSKRRDATALLAERLSDRRLFVIRIWERPEDAGPDWKIPTAEISQAVADTFGAYQVAVMFADPYLWQDYLDSWAARWPDRVVEFPTNVEQRMDKAIERFTTAAGDNEITHDGDGTLARHVKNAVLIKGGRKKIRPGEDEMLAKHYLKMAKRGDGMLIDGAVAAVLAHAAAAHAIEHDMAPKPAPAPLVAWR